MDCGGIERVFAVESVSDNEMVRAQRQLPRTRPRTTEVLDMRHPIPAIHSLPIGTEVEFWSRVERHADDECWPWLGANAGPGTYGRLRVSGRVIGAHVISLVISTGSRPEGAFALHSCDNPPCVNPAHLRWGTPRDNITDAVLRGRHRANERITDEQVVEARRRVAAGERPVDVAADLGVSRCTVERYISGRERSSAGGPIIRERPGNRKLTPEQVRELRQRKQLGEPAERLARAFNISPRAARRVASGESYKNVN